MIRRDIRGRGIDAREAVTQDKECLARLHVGVKLQARGPRGFHLPHAQFIFVAIDLPLPTKVPGGIGVRQEWGEAFERASNARVLLRRGVNLPSAGGGVSLTRTRATVTGRWLHSDLCAPLGLLHDRRRRGLAPVAPDPRSRQAADFLRAGHAARPRLLRDAAPGARPDRDDDLASRALAFAVRAEELGHHQLQGAGRQEDRHHAGQQPPLLFSRGRQEGGNRSQQADLDEHGRRGDGGAAHRHPPSRRWPPPVPAPAPAASRSRDTPFPAPARPPA